LSRLDLDHAYPKDKIVVFDQGYVNLTFLIEKVHDWVEDYVLRSYGTGAIMTGPTYDERGYEFSKKYNLHIKWVVKPNDGSLDGASDETFTDYGVNTGKFDGHFGMQCRTECKTWIQSSVSFINF
jgi:leucyl-tRNA synthetase